MPDLVPARAELIALLTATRTDWAERDVEAAVVRAQLAGWPWVRTLTGFVLLAADPNGTPDELAPAVRNAPPADPEHVHHVVEATKAHLQARGLKGGGT